MFFFWGGGGYTSGGQTWEGLGMSGIGVHNVKIPRNQLKNILKKKTKQNRLRNGKKDISPVSKVLGTLRPLPGGAEVPAWWWWLSLALDAGHSPGNLFRACTPFLEELVLGFLPHH